MNFSREEAIQRIRQYLTVVTGPGETTCQAAARLGIFCRGYDQWSTETLRRWYPWLTDHLPTDASREEVLQVIVTRDRARMQERRVAIACDAKALDHEACLGFNGLSEAELKRQFPQLFGNNDWIIPS